MGPASPDHLVRSREFHFHRKVTVMLDFTDFAYGARAIGTRVRVNIQVDETEVEVVCTPNEAYALAHEILMAAAKAQKAVD